jgi:hypothetical protein
MLVRGQSERIRVRGEGTIKARARSVSNLVALFTFDIFLL